MNKKWSKPNNACSKNWLVSTISSSSPKPPDRRRFPRRFMGRWRGNANIRLIQLCLCLCQKAAQEQSSVPGFQASCAVQKTRVLGDLLVLDRLTSDDPD